MTVPAEHCCQECNVLLAQASGSHLAGGRGRYEVASPAGIELSEPPLIQEYHPVGDKTSFIVL